MSKLLRENFWQTLPLKALNDAEWGVMSVIKEAQVENVYTRLFRSMFYYMP